MAELTKIDIKPGGMLSDIVENDLGYSQHQLVTNLRQKKKGLWESVPGYINHYLIPYGPVEVKAAIEVTDDLTGDRFILFQDRTTLRKVDYDEGDGNGYENETPVILDLPSGISIGTDTTCKFFYFRGVVRITGPEDAEGNGVPLWYGHINRTLFPDAWEELYLGGFETDTESWSGANATLSQYDCDTDADGTVGYAPELVHALKVVQTANDGSARKSWGTMGSGKTIRFLAMVFRPAGGTGNLQIKLGIYAGGGGAQYATLETSTEDEWVMLETTFTSTGTNLHIMLIPSAGAANDTAYFDFIFIEENCPIVINEWVLEKAAINKLVTHIEEIPDILDSGGGDDYKIVLCKNGCVFDESQFSLLEEPVNNGDNKKSSDIDYEIMAARRDVSSIDIEIPGSDLENSFTNKRITGVAVCTSPNVGAQLLLSEDKLVYYVQTELSINEELGDYKYSKETNALHYDPTNLNEIDLAKVSPNVAVGDCYLKVGLRVIVRTRLYADRRADVAIGELDTIITEVGVSTFSIAHPIDPELRSGIGYLPNTSINVTRKWTYDASNGYKTTVGLDHTNKTNEFYEYVDIPTGTIHNTPNYSHFDVISKRSYIVSRETEEDDVIRFSPIDQFDNHPILNICQTEVGDLDRNLAVINRDGRVVILKRNSISQVQHSGNRFYEDIGFAKHGLYSEEGYIVINNVLYFLDKDDIYAFDGNTLIPLLTEEKLKTHYQSHVETSSLLRYDKMNKEILAFLDDHILVAHPEMKEWYKRKTDITPVKGFIDSDKNIILFSNSKFVNLNHDESTFDESIGWEFKTLLADLNSPDKFKFLDNLIFFCKSNGDIDISISDPNESRIYSEEEITPDSGEVAPIQKYPDYLFKEVEITIKNHTDADDLVSSIKKLTLWMNQWQS